jgi:hypothetical protein
VVVVAVAAPEVGSPWVGQLQLGIAGAVLAFLAVVGYAIDVFG